jgi:hypothetical protein
MAGRRSGRAARRLAVAAAPLVLSAAGCAAAQDHVSSRPASQSSPTPARTAAAAAPCRTGELKVSLGPGGAAAGTWASLLEFTNKGEAACTIGGWPAVAGITAAGAATSATNRSGAMDGLDNPGAPQVTLQPGQQAGTDLSGADTSPGGACTARYSELRVSAPGDSVSVAVSAYLAELAGNAPSCGTLAVSAVHPLSDFSFSGQ